jgi:hypothetical protein
MTVRRRKFRIEFDCLIEVSDCMVVIRMENNRQIGLATIVVSVSIFGSEPGGLIEVGLRTAVIEFW